VNHRSTPIALVLWLSQLAYASARPHRDPAILSEVPNTLRHRSSAREASRRQFLAECGQPTGRRRRGIDRLGCSLFFRVRLAALAIDVVGARTHAINVVDGSRAGAGSTPVDERPWLPDGWRRMTLVSVVGDALEGSVER
jgi:hypothetical protein